MKIKDIGNLTKNRANNQFSLNLKLKQLKKIGITPAQILNMKLPKTFKLIKDNQKGGIKNDYRKNENTGG